ncbi:type II secretion system protein [Clostridium beijerinckii]|nr:type II secretion system protein [Clostridium beijerinckii]
MENKEIGGGIISEKKKSAFTLIEIIIVLGITVIVLGIVNSIFITGNKVFSDSDVKTTLQIERQAIQEKISDIGMQAVEIKSVNGDTTSNELNNITISSYDKNGNPHDFHLAIVEDTEKKYKNNSEIYKFTIDGQEISGNIKSFKIDNSIIDISAYTDATKKATALKKISSIKFDIILRKENGYSNVQQPINFGVVFRNK